MTECNYCSYRRLKWLAKGKGLHVVKRPDATYELGGINIYLVPPDEELDHDKHFAAWYMELPDSCRC